VSDGKQAYVRTGRRPNPGRIATLRGSNKREGWREFKKQSGTGKNLQQNEKKKIGCDEKSTQGGRRPEKNRVESFTRIVVQFWKLRQRRIVHAETLPQVKSALTALDIRRNNDHLEDREGREK